MAYRYPPRTCICGEHLWSFKSKLRHQETCDKPLYEKAEQARRDAAADAMEGPTSWERS